MCTNLVCRTFQNFQNIPDQSTKPSRSKRTFALSQRSNQNSELAPCQRSAVHNMTHVLFLEHCVLHCIVKSWNMERLSQKQRFIWNFELLSQFCKNILDLLKCYINTYELEVRRVFYHLAQVNSTSVISSLVAACCLYCGLVQQFNCYSFIVRPLDIIQQSTSEVEVIRELYNFFSSGHSSVDKFHTQQLNFMLEHSLEVSITGLVEIHLHRCDIAAARVAAHQVL